MLELSRLPRVRLFGLHCHIGSQIESVEPYLLAVQSVVAFASRITRELKVNLAMINMGGGFGVPFSGSRGVPTLEEFATSLASAFDAATRSYNMEGLWLAVEPGASMVGKSGVVLLTVNSVKERPSGDIWVSVDGGADILLRATQGWYSFPIVSAGDPAGAPVLRAHVAGPLCYSGDVLAKGVALPPVRRGSVLAVLDAGAYTLSIQNTYNGRLAPAVVMVKDGNARLVRRRGRPEDLVAFEVEDVGSTIEKCEPTAVGG